MSIKDITIIIASFRSEKKIRKCLTSIDDQCNVINVENSDNSEHKRKIEQDFKNVRCILAGKNLGYGHANNLGINEAKTKYALILNPDTELFPETLNNFLVVANKNPNFAIIGPNLIVDKKKNQTQINNSPNLKEVKTIKGFAMFLNLSEFKEVGFFDENFFFFLEEIDLCMRVLKKNKKIYLSSYIPVYHEGGSSHDSTIDYEMELSRNWHWMWSTFYYNKKYNGFLVALIMVLPKFISSILKFVFYSILRNHEKKQIYYQRYSGLINSIFGKSSWYRPKV